MLLAAFLVSAGAIGAGAYFGTRTPSEADRINPASSVTPVTDTGEAAANAPAGSASVAASPDLPEAETPELPALEEPEVTTPEVEQAANVPEAPETPQAPTIDEVRVEPDGLTVVAGRALPGSTIAILLDGIENTTTVAEPTGAFAAVTLLEPTENPQVLSIVQRQGGDEVASLEDVILAPIAAPVVETAEADTAAQPPAQEALIGTEIAALDAPEVEDDVSGLTTPATDDTDVPEVSSNAAPAPEIETETAAVAPSAARSPAPLDRSAPDEPETPDLPERQVVTELEPEAISKPDLPRETVEPATTDLEQQASRQVAVLKSTVSGVEVLAPGPDILDNVSIDTISYSSEGEVQLAGRAQNEARSIRVYLDNAPIATLEVDTDGRWRGELPDVDTGIYRLRVDELGAEGEVTSRLETPFKREDPDVLEAAGSGDTAQARRITVQTGNTLWAIARDRYGEGLLYVQIFEANKDAIRNPDLIFPGQVFDLPEELQDLVPETVADQ